MPCRCPQAVPALTQPRRWRAAVCPPVAGVLQRDYTAAHFSTDPLPRCDGAGWEALFRCVLPLSPSLSHTHTLPRRFVTAGPAYYDESKRSPRGPALSPCPRPPSMNFACATREGERASPCRRCCPRVQGRREGGRGGPLSLLRGWSSPPTPVLTAHWGLPGGVHRVQTRPRPRPAGRRVPSAQPRCHARRVGGTGSVARRLMRGPPCARRRTRAREATAISTTGARCCCQGRGVGFVGAAAATSWHP